MRENHHQRQGTSNCREIIRLLKAYGADHNGSYPDTATEIPPSTSNDAFRVLFREGLAGDESIFGAPQSPFVPDGNTGSAPAFEKTLLPGENHWAMTKDQSSASIEIMPLIFENPVTETWPPQWNANAASKPVRGRAWSGGKIIIGKNDGSVETVKLQAAQGAAVGPRMMGNGLDMFTHASGNQPVQILNIAISAQR